MKRTERFQSLADVQREKERLKAVRVRHQEALGGHWRLLHEPEFRRGLMGDMIGDMLRTWSPLRAIAGFMRSEEGVLGNMLGLALGSRARSVRGRFITWALTAIAPFLLKRVATPERMDHWAHELNRSFQRVRNYFKDRHEARREEASGH